MIPIKRKTYLLLPAVLLMILFAALPVSAVDIAVSNEQSISTNGMNITYRITGCELTDVSAEFSSPGNLEIYFTGTVREGATITLDVSGSIDSPGAYDRNYVAAGARTDGENSVYMPDGNVYSASYTVTAADNVLVNDRYIRMQGMVQHQGDDLDYIRLFFDLYMQESGTASGGGTNNSGGSSSGDGSFGVIAVIGGIAVVFIGGTIKLIKNAEPNKQKSAENSGQQTARITELPADAAEYLGGPEDNPYTEFEQATTCKLS